MPIALGTGRTGLIGEGGSEKLDNRNSPIILMCWGSQSKNEGQQKEMRSTPKDRRHFTPLQSSRNSTPWVHTHSPILSYSRQHCMALQPPLTGLDLFLIVTSGNPLSSQFASSQSFCHVPLMSYPDAQGALWHCWCRCKSCVSLHPSGPSRFER